jgi:hypothetical protein
MIGGKPIKLVFFIQLVCSSISIACSSHYFGRQHIWGSSTNVTEELPRQELGHLQCKSCWRPTNNTIDNPVKI